jgi:hypothetical protein
MNIYGIKSLVPVIALTTLGLTMTACSGDNGARKGKDTVKSVYGSANDTTRSSESTIDTSKVTSGDNSASGGVKAHRDTGKPATLKK